MDTFAYLIMSGSDSTREPIKITGSYKLLGRENLSGVVNDRFKGVSRKHAVIEKKEDGYWLLDNGSRNGTFLNGRRLESGKVRLKHKDEISLAGVVAFRFYDPKETESVASSERLLGIWIDEKKGSVWVDNVLLKPPLSEQQFRLLKLLRENEGKVISKPEIIRTVWPDELPEGNREESYKSLLKRLKRRLAKASPKNNYIETVRGHGLRLNTPADK